MGDSANVNTGSANVGEVITYGWVSVYNSGREDIVLESAELLGPGATEGVVVRRPTTVPDTAMVAWDRGYPPRWDEPMPPPRPISGTVVRGPSDEEGIELLFAITPQREGRFVWPGVRVHYRVGDKKYVFTDPDDAFVLCVPKVEFCDFPPDEEAETGSSGS